MCAVYSDTAHIFYATRVAAKYKEYFHQKTFNAFWQTTYTVIVAFHFSVNI